MAVLAINASRAEASTVTLPVVFWVVGGIDPDRYAAAEKAGKLDVLPANHAPDFAPVIHPTLRAGVEAMLAAAGAWLASGTEG